MWYQLCGGFFSTLSLCCLIKHCVYYGMEVLRSFNHKAQNSDYDLTYNQTRDLITEMMAKTIWSVPNIWLVQMSVKG